MVLCVAWYYQNIYLCSIKVNKPPKNNVMRKFIFTANVIALIALVPAVLFGYLHSTAVSTNAKQNIEIVKDVTNGQDEGITLHMVKSF